MAIVLIAPAKKNLDYWKKKLKEEAARKGYEVDVWIGEEEPEVESVQMAVVWKHPHESLYRFPNLLVVASMGAGVDHIMKDHSLPAHLTITRIVDEKLAESMSNYLLAAVLNHHKRLWDYLPLQEQKKWGYSDEPERSVQIGILGMGALGKDIAVKLHLLGFKVAGYSSSRKEVKGVQSYAGKEELVPFLQAVNVLICLLPLTKETQNFLNIGLFENCRKGTFLINVARGEHLVDEDLLLALDEGYLSGAMLDVFRKEPLPKGHPFWEQPEIIMTPHIASITKPDAAIPQLVENYLRLKAGEPLQNTIDRTKGY